MGYLMYSLKFKKSVQKDLKKIGQEASKKILTEVRNKLLQDPKIGIPLKGHEGIIWKYRIGDYRVLYTFDEKEIYVLVIRIGHRKVVYRNI